MTKFAGYMLQLIPIATLGAIYGLVGFELAVVMGIAMVAGGANQP